MPVLAVTETIETIDAVVWEAVPGPPGWYRPEEAASALRDLARAGNLVEAGSAGARLGGGGILHGHSAAVFPAAAVAAPILLDVVAHGHALAGDVALGLLDEALVFDPHEGYARVADPDGARVAVCCVVAAHLRDRADLLTGRGRSGRSLLASAAGHWRFEVRERVTDGGVGVAFGTLEGRLPRGTRPAELRLGGSVVGFGEVVPEYPLVEGDGEACLRVSGVPPEELLPGAVLSPAECGERVH